MASVEHDALRWRCRRGMLELDILLGHFLETGYELLDSKGKESFQRLLEEGDDRLQAWLLEAEQPDDGGLADVAARIRCTATD